MIKLTAIYELFYTIICSIYLYMAYDFNVALSCAFGGSIMMANTLGIYFLWKIIFSKKSIALAIVAIILKYLILGFVLWYIAQVNFVRPIGLVIGLSTLVLAILSATLTKSFVKNNKSKAR